MDGKLAVVTGGGLGIGRAIALKFAAHGAAVCVLDINKEYAEATSRQIVDFGGSATAYACDVVNNAGISQIGTVESTSERISTPFCARGRLQLRVACRKR